MPDFAHICAMTGDPSRLDELETYLVAESRLPGPRANLALASAVADCLALSGLTEPWWARLTTWLAMAEDEAPTGHPREFLPFSATQALGACYPVTAERRPEIAIRLREMANDGRWRIREAVSLALQRIGAWDAAVVTTILDEWLSDATLLELRAIVTALAHPPLLQSDDVAKASLQYLSTVADRVVAINAVDRKTPEFKALRKGMGFAPSLTVAVQPEEGFKLLQRWIESGDEDLIWIVRENVKKARLSDRYSDDVTRLLDTLQ